MYKYIYKVTDPTTNEFYIGSRSSNIEPELDISYKGSMVNWKPEKCRLVKEILIKFPLETTYEALLESEADIIKSVIDDPLNRNYHIPTKKFHTKGMKLSPETRLKMSISRKGTRPPSTLGVKMSEEQKIKIGNKHRGKIVSQEARLKMSLAKKGKPSCAKGRVVSEETRLKISKANKGKPSPNLGKKATEETRLKLSLSHMGIPSKNKGRKYKNV